jgi:hypothetical protein
MDSQMSLGQKIDKLPESNRRLSQGEEVAKQVARPFVWFFAKIGRKELSPFGCTFVAEGRPLRNDRHLGLSFRQDPERVPSARETSGHDKCGVGDPRTTTFVRSETRAHRAGSHVLAYRLTT